MSVRKGPVLLEKMSAVLGLANEPMQGKSSTPFVTRPWGWPYPHWVSTSSGFCLYSSHTLLT